MTTQKNVARTALEPKPTRTTISLNRFPTALLDELDAEAGGMDVPRSRYILEILHGLGKKGRMDRYIQTKVQRAKQVSDDALGIDSGE